MDRPAIVLDSGTGTSNAGFAGENEPRSDMITVIGRPRRFPSPIPVIKEAYFGQDALSKRGILVIKYPIQSSAIVDWQNMEALWHHTFHNELDVAPEEHSVLMSVSSSNYQNSDLEKIAEIMFENFKVPALYIENHAVLALFNAGKTTGIVVDSGHGSTNIVPVRDGAALNEHSKTFEVSGHDLTVFLQTMLTDKGFSFDQIPIIADMKEKLCYVARNFENEMNPAAESSNIDKAYEMPEGDVVTIGNERFRCPEVMFQPSCLGQEKEGIHKHIFDSVMSCDPEIQKELFRSVVLSGGNTLFSGMPERLQHELKEIAPPLTEVQVEATSDRKHSVWVGGSILASLPSFQEKWISKKLYDEIGPSVCHRKE